MPKAYSRDLRERVSRFVDAGHSRHAAAAHFGVSVSFVVRLCRSGAGPEGLIPSPAAGGGIPSSSRTAAFCFAGSAKRTI